MRFHDDKVDVLCTIFWFWYLASALKTDSSLKVRKEVKPSTKRGSRQHEHTSFSVYRHGKHMPNANTIEFAERRVPGSARLINCVVWKVLRYLGQPTGERKPPLLKEWSCELPLEIQRILGIEWGESVPPLKPDTLSALGKIAHLDSLAALTIFFAGYQHINDQESTWKVCQAIWKMLLLLSPEFLEGRVCTLLGQIFSERVLSQIDFHNCSLEMKIGREYSELCDFFNNAVQEYWKTHYRNSADLQKHYCHITYHVHLDPVGGYSALDRPLSEFALILLHSPLAVLLAPTIVPSSRTTDPCIEGKKMIRRQYKARQSVLQELGLRKNEDPSPL